MAETEIWDYEYDKKQYVNAIDIFLKNGYERKQITFRDQIFDIVVLKNKWGQIIERKPIIENGVILYITGIYTVKSGHQRGRRHIITVRAEIRLLYADTKNELVKEEIKDKVEDIAEKIYGSWLDENGFTLDYTPDKIFVKDMVVLK